MRWQSGEQKSTSLLFKRCFLTFPVLMNGSSCRSRAEDNIQQKALQTVAQGQKSENLLDLDSDEPASMTDSTISAAAFANIPAAASSMARGPKASSTKNPLDELMDLFANNTMSSPAGTGAAATSPLSALSPSTTGGALGGMDSLTQPSTMPSTSASAQTDAFGGLDGFGMASPPSQGGQTQGNTKSAHDDLMGLF